MKEFRILPEVSVEVAEAANWYDREGYIGLGDRFLGTFYSYLPHLQQDGEIYRIVYSDFRRVLIRPFPYALYYRYHGDLLIISLLIHAARNPLQIRSLLRERRS